MIDDEEDDAMDDEEDSDYGSNRKS